MEALATWSERSRRDLPWRRTRDPWAVLVSEVMLQQTQAERVAPRFEMWMRRWPTPHALDAAEPAEVIAAWSGLGYNRRAVGLHRCSGVIVSEHGGRVPDRLDELMALPGIGAYTARAVLAFAYEVDVGVVDVNAARVLARAVAGATLRASEAQGLADSLVPAGRSWAHNQAMLDLGATVCTARRPACGACPLAAASACAWRREYPAAAAGGGADEGAARRGREQPAAPVAPDPAVGSAGTGGRKSVFAGSDRQGRGRLVAALAGGPVAGADLAAVAGWPGDGLRASRVAASLVADGLAVVTADGGLAYPVRVRPGPPG